MGDRDVILKGAPYAPDINALLKAFGDPPGPGLIDHGQIAEVLAGTAQDSPRYQRVVRAWQRKLERSHRGVRSRWADGQGVLFLTPSEQAKATVGDVAQIKRDVGRASTRNAKIVRDKLAPSELRDADAALHGLATLKMALTKTVRELKAPDPQASANPRVRQITEVRKESAQQARTGMGLAGRG